MEKNQQIIEKLKKEVGKKFKQLSLYKITNENGYSIDKNENIIGLNLESLRISDYSFLKELKNLTTLELSSNQISDYSFLKELKNLKILELHSNQISDISFLKELKNLTMLGLGNNQISDISFLKELKNLKVLYLGSNKISDISFLKELKNLTMLHLWSNQISDYSFLKELKNLTTLNLSHNQISDYSFLKELKNLKTLYLGKNQIFDYSFLKELNNLTTLNSWDNQISDYSFLKELKNLKTLYLRKNKISDISFLKELKNLTTLKLMENQISDISFLKELKNLTTLDLSHNQISDYSFLKELKNLTTLDLSHNQISDISFLKELKNLTTLDLSHNQISDISFLKELKNLTTLKLMENQISDISFLKELKNLTALDLSHNQIFDIQAEITQLKYLNYLNIGKNKLSKLNPALLELELEIFWVESFYGQVGLNLYNNPLETPPIEIVQKGTDAVKAYFKSLEGGEKQPLNEVKVMLVGDGGSGKTSLVKRLLGEKFNKNEPQTHGITIKQWELKDKKSKIHVHLWDFGGQEIMHALHQFFLSKRSLYILVLDGRKEEDEEYWLKHIESFGGDSPILVVLNKIDDNPSFDKNRLFLQEKYAGIKGFHKISCKKGTGIKSFVESLSEELKKVELSHTPVAKSWYNVKTQLEGMTDNFISYDKYIEMCSKENIVEKTSMDTLVGFLNDLGLIVHFKDFDLEDTYVLEPKWVTGAVYKIINSDKLSEKKGVLILKLLDEILKQKKETDYFYPRDKYRYLIDLMKKFELCYKIDDNTILIPNLLEVQEPKIQFDYKDSLKFIIQYDFLPKAIMPRFIVKMHNDIKDDLRWRTGVVLEDTSLHCTAIIKADKREKKFFIFVNGEQKRDYFSIIRKSLRDINKSFEKMEVKELVPLPDNDKITIEYEELIGLEKMGKEFITVGKLGKDFSVKLLLDGIEKEDERMKKDLFGGIKANQIIIGNQYTAEQVGVQGTNGHAHDMTFDQTSIKKEE